MLHDFHRTTIAGMQMYGISEKEASVMVVAISNVIRKHYKRLDQSAIAGPIAQRRLGPIPHYKFHAPVFAREVRAGH